MRLKLYAKCDDRCGYVLSQDGERLVDTDGYPPYIPGITDTDSVHIEIDLDTGKIVGFDAALVQQYVQNIILDHNGEDEDEDA